MTSIYLLPYIKNSAESEGFKPPVRINRTADFESAPFDHSGNFPSSFLLSKSSAKVGIIIQWPKLSLDFFEKNALGADYF